MSMFTTYLNQHLDSYVNDLRTLSAIDSGPEHKPGVDAVQDWLEQRLRSCGFAIERQEATCFGR